MDQRTHRPNLVGCGALPPSTCRHQWRVLIEYLAAHWSATRYFAGVVGGSIVVICPISHYVIPAFSTVAALEVLFGGRRTDKLDCNLSD